MKHLLSNVPIVVIVNTLEGYGKFLSKEEHIDVFSKWCHHGERALYWLGASKLVLASAPLTGIEGICRGWGYENTRVLSPLHPTFQISLDILGDPKIIEELVEFSGENKQLQIIAFTTTPELYQLAESLRSQYGLTIFLPESPLPENLWLRDYADTKSGFRWLAAQWLTTNELIPFGVVNSNITQAADVVAHFSVNKRSCIIKADQSVSSMGSIVFPNDEIKPVKDILVLLESNPFMRDDLIIAEEFIPATTQLSPSVEIFVPPSGDGMPEITYVSNQIFGTCGDFDGVLISRHLLKESWYKTLAESGLCFAQKLQEMGYVGHFDLDAVVDDNNRLYLMETNTRRTGGTHVHELALFLIGEQYLEKVALLSNNHIPCKGIDNPETLITLLEDLFYPIDSEQRGIVIVSIATLATFSAFGCVFIAPDVKGTLALKQLVNERLQSASR